MTVYSDDSDHDDDTNSSVRVINSTLILIQKVLKRYRQAHALNQDGTYQEGPWKWQQVRTVSQPNLVIGGTNVKQMAMLKEMESFAQEIRKRSNNYNSSEAFARQFSVESKRLIKILDEPDHGPYLLYDFQVMVDTEGRFYYTDLERAIHPQPWRWPHKFFFR